MMEISTRIKPMKLLDYQNEIVNKIFKIADYIFRHEVSLKFSGFLLYGPPGNGKTEIAKQAAIKIDESDPANIYLVDGSNIASPKWGDAEEKLKKIFTEGPTDKVKIIIFDDIESTFIGRDIKIAQEWHFSINSEIFHLLDNMNNKDNKDNSKKTIHTLVIATTNKQDMVDPALISRLYPISVPELNKEQLKQFAEYSLTDSFYEVNINKILESIKIKIEQNKIKSLRDVEHEILLEVIENIGE